MNNNWTSCEKFLLLVLNNLHLATKIKTYLNYSNVNPVNFNLFIFFTSIILTLINVLDFS